MRAIHRKLKSRAGASITFALLIFLVCAVVSGVVIVAASTAGGRISGVQETDQRYYAAVATAETLRDIFDGSEVEVAYAPATKALETASITASPDSALLKDISFYVATDQTYPGNATALDPITTDSAEGYTCTVTPKLENGLLSFVICAEGGTQKINSGTYTLTVVFASNVKKSAQASGATSAKATVKWHLHSLSKGRASATPAG